MKQHHSGDIVIVDDNPNNLRVLGIMRQRFGYKIRPALTADISATKEIHLTDDFIEGLGGIDALIPNERLF